MPTDLITPAFGPNSFERHGAAALAAGATFEPCARRDLAWDVDRPEDLERVLRHVRATNTRAALIAAGVPERLARRDGGAPAAAREGGGGGHGERR